MLQKLITGIVAVSIFVSCHSSPSPSPASGQEHQDTLVSATDSVFPRKPLFVVPVSKTIRVRENFRFIDGVVQTGSSVVLATRAGPRPLSP